MWPFRSGPRRDPALRDFAEFLFTQLQADCLPDLAHAAQNLSDDQLRCVADWLVAPGFNCSVKECVIRALAKEPK